MPSSPPSMKRGRRSPRGAGIEGAAARSQTTDVAFVVGLETDARLPRIVLGTAQARLYAAPSLIHAAGAPRHARDLAALPMLAQGCAPGGTTSWTLTDRRGVCHRITTTPRFVSTDPDLLLAAAVAGSGVVAIADFLAASAVRAGTLVPVLADHVAERHDIVAVIQRRQRDQAVRRFVAEVGEHLRRALSR